MTKKSIDIDEAGPVRKINRQKSKKRIMRVSGKSVFRLQRLMTRNGKKKNSRQGR